jgi:peptidoglycan/xylan/chitin deacetylase (PgdA/CDA1 family)
VSPITIDDRDRRGVCDQPEDGVPSGAIPVSVDLASAKDGDGGRIPGARGPVTRNRVFRAAIRRSMTAIGPRAERYLPSLRSFLTRGLTVFVFHEVTDTPSAFQSASRGYVTTLAFRDQIQWIGDRFDVIAPTDLPQLGDRGELPQHAALIAFDDAWAGVFRTGLPILASLGIPAVCFLNMATVDGMPDLSAVRRYERMTSPAGRQRLDRRLDANHAPRVLAEIRKAYGHDPAFASYQGPTATHEDLARAASNGSPVWFGSHLFHHWDVSNIETDLLTASVLANAHALSVYNNSLPAMATPYGRTVAGLSGLSLQLGISLVFVGTGAQNWRGSGTVLDRLSLAPEPSGPRDWWYGTHRRRLLGNYAS